MAYNVRRGRARPSALGDSASIIAGISNKKIRITSLVLTASGGANNVQLKSSGGTVLDQFNLAAGEKFVLPPVDEYTGWYEGVTGEGIIVNLSAALQVGVSVNGSAVD